jgi:hypothetical protein
MRKYILILVLAFVILIAGTLSSVYADSGVFTQITGKVKSVDSNLKTAVIEYIQPQPAIMSAACPAPDCSIQTTVRNPDTISQGQILLINGFNVAENDITKMKVGDSVIVYLRSNVPYAVIDLRLSPSGCDPITRICSASSIINSGSSGGGVSVGGIPILPISPTSPACTMEAKECSDGSYVSRSGPNCQFASCPGVSGGGTGTISGCLPRPACLDATPRCLITEPSGGWCSPGTTPPPSICTPRPACLNATPQCLIPEPANGWCSPGTPGVLQANLTIGNQNSDVIYLQQRLQSLGYFPGSLQPTGYFGSVTLKAVTDFQRAMGLPTTGFVGPMTRNALGN